MYRLHAPGDIVATRYRILSLLGQSGQGNTYVAEDLTSSKLVAIKAISLHQMDNWKSLELLERQAQVLADLNHPAIPRYIDYCCTDTTCDRAFYLIQQLIQGDSLVHLVECGWQPSEPKVKNLALQVLEILDYLHQQSPPVIHRDIQPHNLIQDQQGNIHLVDFGSVKATSRSPRTYSSTLVGAYGYIAPEQFQGKAYFGTDLYGLGATLLFVLTGKTPDELYGNNLRIDVHRHVQLSAHLTNWLAKMLEISPKARFQSATEALASLKRSAQSRAIRPQPRSKADPEPAVSNASHIANPKPPQENLNQAHCLQQPFGSRVIVRRRDGQLTVEIPPKGSLVNSVGNFWDVLRFWSQLEIAPHKFTLTKGRLGLQYSSYAGLTKDLIKAEFSKESNIWGETKNHLLIWEGVIAHTFGEDLTSVEQEWLAEEITDFLGYLRLLQRLEKLIDESAL